MRLGDGDGEICMGWMRSEKIRCDAKFEGVDKAR